MVYPRGKELLLLGLSLLTPNALGRQVPDQDVDLPDFEFPASNIVSTKRDFCPSSCSDSGPKGFSWPILNSIKALKRCKEPLLFESAAQFPIESRHRHTVIRACKADDDSDLEEDRWGPVCLSSVDLQTVEVNLEVGSVDQDTTSSSHLSHIVEAASQLKRNVLEDPTCDQTAVLARSGDATLGLFVGSEIRKSSSAGLIQQFMDVIKDTQSLPSTFAAQLCGPKGKRSAAHTFGIYYDTTNDIEAVHETVQTWVNGTCVNAPHNSDTLDSREIRIIPATAKTMGAGNALDTNVTFASKDSSTSEKRKRSSNASRVNLVEERRDTCRVEMAKADDSCLDIATRCGVSMADLKDWNGGSFHFCAELQKNDRVCCSEGEMPEGPSQGPPPTEECDYVIVDQGDTCPSLAESRCGIDLEDFYEYNGDGNSDFCYNLVPGKPVCCSSGSIVDLRPEPNADGSCYVHLVRKGDVCDTIKEQYNLFDDDLDRFNVGKTWGWFGCGKVLEHAKICVSQGDPPMPSHVKDAQCGPQKPGTKRPYNDTDIADLNPCPLNVCCNIWGSCGTTEDFCIDTSIEDTPGTAEEGTHGCISNCGMDIVNNDEGPSSFARLAYFEGWNQDRKCLNMDITEVGGPHTMIHFAFGWINEDFTVGISDDSKGQFEKFTEMDSSIKKIISYGGWAFSNEPGTSHIIRNGVKPGNRAAFISSIVGFVDDNNLDGVDIDWEYPGADDIEGSDPGGPEDGPNYLQFLKDLRDELPSGKSIAIAAPASYWYLRHFPIAEISEVVDYIVYMTYDLAGQWDVGNEYAADGCEEGNCLRSHVNITRTENSLAMVTKAGVKSNKIYVGITSYGRSFKMTDSTCRGPTCTYEGERNQSPAEPGYCTGEGGYLADAEIKTLRSTSDSMFGGHYEQYYDEDSDSDISIFAFDNWVAWMDYETKERRIDLYKELNFGGASDWAIDLQRESKDGGNDDNSDDDDEEDGVIDLDLNCNLDNTYDSLDAIEKDAGDMHPTCAATHTVEVLKGMLDDSLSGYDEAADGYDGLFDWYEKYIKSTLDERLRLFMHKKDGKGMDFFSCFADEGWRNGPSRDDAKEVDCRDLPMGFAQNWNYWFELDDKEGYEDALWDEGIDPEWVELGYWHKEEECHNTGGGSGNCWDRHYIHHDYPIGKDDIEIPNPRDVVEDARDNMDTIKAEYDALRFSLTSLSWTGSPADALEVLDVPPSMLSEAVESMKKVKEIGKDFKEEQEKELILQIVEGVLFLIPFVGAGVGALGRVGARMARLLMGVEGIGGAGLGVYALVENPEMAPVMILGMILGTIGSGSRKDYKDLAKGMRDMKPDHKAVLGKTYDKNHPKVESIITKSCMR